MDTHPSKDIKGTLSNELKGKKIVLCITGSVGAIRCPEIARKLMRNGAELFTVMSQMSQNILHPHLMEWATGNPVITELTGKIEHVALAGQHINKVDLILIAPATANTISKIACGIDDTPVTSVVSTAFGSEIPIMVVPAMHESMYNHPILIENIKKLKDLGVEFVGPRIEEDKAKIANTEEIIEIVIRKLAIKDMVGLRVLVTAGPTLEYIDPVRIITNKSSGKMGAAIAMDALRRGAEVILVYGPGSANLPLEANVIQVETAKEMHDAVFSELKSKRIDILIATAAVADWALKTQYKHKISTHITSELVVKLKPTPKIIDDVKKISPKTFLVAFRAEYNLSDEDLIQSAYERLKTAKADLIAVNDVGREGVGFMVDTNELFIIDGNKKIIHVPLTTKQKVAKKLLDVVAEKFSI